MEELKTGIVQYDGEELRIYWSVKEIPKPSELKKMQEILINTPIKLIPQLRLSIDQMKLITINITILECKFLLSQYTYLPQISINITILECKSKR